MKHFLIIEDDKELSHLIYHSLKNEHVTIDCAYDGAKAQSLLETYSYDLVILDLMIPIINGLEVLKHIREFSNVPILIISAKSKDTDKVIGLGYGADDYLTKPFSLIELSARTQALLRRSNGGFMGNSSEEKLIYKHLTLNTHSREFIIGETPMELTNKEYELMKLLLKNQNGVISKSMIYKVVWKGEAMYDDNNLMVLIRRLRKKIEQDPSNPTILTTVWGIGYKLG